MVHVNFNGDIPLFNLTCESVFKNHISVSYLNRRFDLRFIVIHDRFDKEKYQVCVDGTIILSVTIMMIKMMMMMIMPSAFLVICRFKLFVCFCILLKELESLKSFYLLPLKFISY